MIVHLELLCMSGSVEILFFRHSSWWNYWSPNSFAYIFVVVVSDDEYYECKSGCESKGIISG